MQICLRVCGEYVDWFSIGPDDTGEPLGIALNPFRDIMHLAVLPSSKPKQHQPQVVGACALDKSIYIG
ncbi:MAG: hypothetical protein ACRD4I_17145, partial [Candidatus Angelobacter sp.]